MPGLSDRPPRYPRKGDSGGVSLMDIAALPLAERRVLLAVLREPGAAETGITAQALADRLGGPDNLAGILAELTARGWLTEYGQSGAPRYKINLAGRRGSGLGPGIWTALSDSPAGEDRHDQGNLPADDPRPNQRKGGSKR